jgi:hypothetical protein
LKISAGFVKNKGDLHISKHTFFLNPYISPSRISSKYSTISRSEANGSLNTIAYCKLLDIWTGKSSFTVNMKLLRKNSFIMMSKLFTSLQNTVLRQNHTKQKPFFPASLTLPLQFFVLTTWSIVSFSVNGVIAFLLFPNELFSVR